MSDEQNQERPPHQLPTKYRARVFDNLAIGESADASCYSLMVLPDGHCYLDQFTIPVEHKDERITVTRLTETTCRVDLKHAGKYRFIPRPVSWSIFPFQCWHVAEIISYGE